ncbi:MAG: formylglycine-generating enzyme family protein, partial [Saprospiraceae bacterium]|nr:formylglycine-generating enzyme family protein [Saprospiraceae bacterium]
TQSVWQSVMRDNPSNFKGENRPVENVSWDDVQEFLKKLNSLTKQDYRLPTEAEWEFAARGGKHSEEYLYAGSDKLKQVGWYNANSNGETHEVGQKLGNELGLYDMSGNVYEWCYDWYNEKYYEECYKKGVVEDPQGPVQGYGRVVRGGSYFLSAQDCRAAYRIIFGPANRNSVIGFRLALSLQSVG